MERRIVRELCAVLAASRGVEDPALWLATPFDFEELDCLVYLKAVLSESLRL